MVKIERWKVQREMQKKGIETFKDLAAIVGVTPQTVSAWFRGAAFTSQNLEALCLALNCEPGDILTMDPKELALVA
jgi:DNA-binding Xre family transcriptional regulator